MRKYVTINSLFLFFFLAIGAVLRFSYLDWGKPFFFHPDENNIATAIAQLSLTQWNPHFFAYGSLPMYVTFLVSLMATLGHPNYSAIIYTLRFISATLSFFLIPSLFYIGKALYSKTVGILAAILASCSVGFIQFAHFGTFEMWLSFFTIWFFYGCFLLYKHTSQKHVLFTGIIGGILFSIKISTLVFLPIPLLLMALGLVQKKMQRKKIILFCSLYCLLIFGIVSITNPFFYFDTTSVIQSLSYESSVALGTVSVFYTQSFRHTLPIVYQLRYVFPFLLNPLIFVASFIGFFFFCFFLIKKRYYRDILLFVFLALTVLSQATVFVKWTRYMLPTLPFLYLMLASVLARIPHAKFRFFLSAFLSLASFVFACAFFFTVYPTDSRIQAADFIKQQHLVGSAFTEPYDLGILPFTAVLPDLHTINIYTIETNPLTRQRLLHDVRNDVFFVSLSQRLMRTRFHNAKDFPYGNAFYTKMLNGSLGYKIIYQTPCNFWCMLTYAGNPATSVEETASVFDHPVVTIFQHE